MKMEQKVKSEAKNVNCSLLSHKCSVPSLLLAVHLFTEHPLLVEMLDCQHITTVTRSLELWNGKFLDKYFSSEILSRRGITEGLCYSIKDFLVG